MFWQLISRVFTHFLSFALFVTFMTWVFIAIGVVVTFFRTDHDKPKTFRGFLRYCVPPEMISTQSCRVDIVFYLVNRFSVLLLVGPFLIGSVFASTLTYQGLSNLFGPHPQLPESTLVWVCVGIVVMIATDFATFYTHYVEHKVPALWQFHKVHHSSEFLIPITNRRFHPVQTLFDNTGEMLTAGILLGVFCYAFSMPIYENTIAGVDAYYLVNAMSFHHLRHSHIYLSYGRLEKWILSPAQHHLHHSQESRHWDKNFGLFLAVWDRLFGTLLYAEPPGTYRLGLPNGEGDTYRSVFQLYTTPFVNVWRMVRPRLPAGGQLQHGKAAPEGEPYPGAS